MSFKPSFTSPLSNDFFHIIGYDVTPIFNGRAADGYLFVNYRLNRIQPMVFGIRPIVFNPARQSE